MNIFTAQETAANYVKTGVAKTKMPFWKMILLSIYAGAIIAFAGMVSNTAAHAVVNVGLFRFLLGATYGLGLGIVVVTGGELFLGNCLIIIPLLEKEAKWSGAFRNWITVWCGNLVGAMLVSAGIALFGQLNHSNNGLAVFTMRLAMTKMSLTWTNTMVWGLFCNFLVCAGVFCALCAHDFSGKMLGSFLGVTFFITAGFDNVVANMYYIFTGLFASTVPRYIAAAQEAGLNLSTLTWANCFAKNLIPATIGNWIGGCLFGAIMWAGHLYKKKS